MKNFFKKAWGVVTAYPSSFDDYVGVGRWLVYKKLLVLLVILPVLLTCVLVWWLACSEKPFELPVFYYFEDRLKVFSGEAVLLNEADKVIYRGQISAGICAGRGKQFAPPDETLVYEGDFLGGTYSGRGRLYEDGALVYEGGFLDGRRSGSGTLYEGDKIKYQGQFVENLYSGKGVLHQDKKPLYEGDFLDGLYEGDGILYDESGAAIYTGGFAKGKYSGSGAQTTPEGTTVYEGEFLNGRYHGAGRLYADGGVRLAFQGNFVKGRPDRSGSLYNAQGQLLYEGNVYNGGADYIGLLGLPVAALQKQVRELPVIYYGGGYAGYLYRELGFAAVTQYDYTMFQAPETAEFSSAADGIELFLQPADDLVVHTILVEGVRFYDQIPTGQTTEIERTTLTGFEAFMESRLARVQSATYPLDFDVTAMKRGDQLYEVMGMPETVSYNGTGVLQGSVYYIYRAGASTKGAVPEVVFCRKAEFGG